MVVDSIRPAFLDSPGGRSVDSNGGGSVKFSPEGGGEMADRVERLGRSRVQHGNLNRRIYVMKLNPGDVPGILDDLDALARRRGYTKILAKVPDSAASSFRSAGYRTEARVPGFFRGRRTAKFMSRFLDPARRRERSPERVASVLALTGELESLYRTGDSTEPPKGTENPHVGGSSGGSEAPSSASPEAAIRFRSLTPEDAPDMAAVYGDVFRSYPFPIDDPDHLRTGMAEDVLCVGAESGGRLVALAAAEMDPEESNAEMTDFATRPEWRRRGLARRLLARMEREVRVLGIRTAYTIARAGSAGMNLTFARSAYAFGGTLVNNTQIAGRIESMNVWYKRLDDSRGANRYP